jgi:hypothetical protein
MILASKTPRQRILSVGTLCLIAILCLGTVAIAQPPNIAPQAVATHSGGGATTYAPSNYNDGIIAAQGALPWGWTTGSSSSGTSAWINFMWSTPMTMGEMKLFYAGISNRYLAGATIQYWTGSAWATAGTFSTTVYTDWERVISFAPVTTTQLRITNFLMAPVGQTSNPNFREIEIRNSCTGSPSTVSFSAPQGINLPGDIPISYTVSHPLRAFTATLTFRFYTPLDVLVHMASSTVEVNANTVNGVFNVPSGALSPGFYRLETTFNVMDICDKLSDVVQSQVIMILAPGQEPCRVWPGDANNDGIVNFSDRKALNQYIQEANLRPTWLTGPARYRVDATTNPMTFFKWEGQVSVPWNTPTGCHMDTDGNGMIDNFDYLAMKLNWLRTHGSTLKGPGAFSAGSFDLDQNSPNPFNPVTRLRYSVPEPSSVRLVVTDAFGRIVATLVDGNVPAGVHTAAFSASGLPSGTYFAVATMTGTETGLGFTKTVKMSVSK